MAKYLKPKNEVNKDIEKIADKLRVEDLIKYIKKVEKNGKR